MTTRDKLIVEFEAKIGDFKRNTDKVQRQMKNTERAVATSTKQMKNSFREMKSFAANAFSVFAVVELGKQSFNTAKKVQNMELAMEAAFKTAGAARQEIQFLRDATNRLGVNTLDTANAYAKYAVAAKGAGLSTAEIRKSFEQLVGGMRVFGLTSAESVGALKALEQIASKGRLSMEELRLQLGDRLPGVMKIAADSMGVTTEKLLEMIEAGLVPAGEFLVKFGNEFENRFGDQIVKASQNAQAEIERLKNALEQLQAGVGGLLLRSFGALAGGINDAAEGIANFIDEVVGGATPLEQVNEKIKTLKTLIEQSPQDSFLRQQLDDAMMLRMELIKLAEQKQLQQEANLQAGGTQDQDNGISKERREELEKFRDSIMKNMLTPIQRARKQMQMLNEAHKEGIIDSANHAKGMAYLQGEIEKVTDKAKSLERTMADDLREAINRPIKSFDDLKDVALDALQEIAIQAVITGFKLDKIVTGTKGAGGGGGILGSIGTTIGSGLGDFFGGFFADGGQPPVGKPSIVGERGAELFVPKTAGTIIPNEKLGMNKSVTYNIDARGAERGVEQRIMQALKQVDNSIEPRAITAVQSANKRGSQMSTIMGNRS